LTPTNSRHFSGLQTTLAYSYTVCVGMESEETDRSSTQTSLKMSIALGYTPHYSNGTWRLRKPHIDAGSASKQHHIDAPLTSLLIIVITSLACRLHASLHTVHIRPFHL